MFQPHCVQSAVSCGHSLIFRLHWFIKIIFYRCHVQSLRVETARLFTVPGRVLNCGSDQWTNITGSSALASTLQLSPSRDCSLSLHNSLVSTCSTWASAVSLGSCSGVRKNTASGEGGGWRLSVNQEYDTEILGRLKWAEGSAEFPTKWCKTSCKYKKSF